MSYKVPLSVLQLRRVVSCHGFYWKGYCNTVKPEIQKETYSEINCFSLMSKNEPCPVQVDSQAGLVKAHENVYTASVREIIDETYARSFSVKGFVIALKAIVRTQTLHTDRSFCPKSDLRFLNLCESFEFRCSECNPWLLISALKNLLIVGVNQEAKVIETIGKKILQNTGILDCNAKLECLSLLCCCKSITDTQKQIVEVLVKEISQSIRDINTGPAVFKLLRVYDHFDKKSSKKIDLKLVELVRDFKPHYLCKALCLLAEKQSRNKTLLNSISQYLQISETKPSIKQTVDVLYALNTLNYPDEGLLVHLTEGRTSEILETDNPAMISSLLNASGHLRWRHEEIMEACGKWILNNIEKCSSREFVSYILTAATLNYTASDDIVKHLLLHLKEEKIESSIIWLDVVWSLAILGHTDKEMLSSVFKKDFYEPLLDGNDFRVMNNKLKLMNLKAVVKIKHPEIIFSCDLFLDSVEVPKSSEVENSKKSVIDSLSNFILLEKYLHTNQCTSMGISIDAEFIMNDRGKLLPLAEHVAKGKSDMLIKRLPPGARRCAVLVLTHKDFTLNELRVTGIVSLTTEILKSNGYTVIQIPYSEFSANRTIVKKAHHLQEKILTAVKSKS